MRDFSSLFLVVFVQFALWDGQPTCMFRGFEPKYRHFFVREMHVFAILASPTGGSATKVDHVVACAEAIPGDVQRQEGQQQRSGRGPAVQAACTQDQLGG